MSIQSIDIQIDGLNVVWRDGSSSRFPWLWIRDHSESGVDLHPDSKQRQIDVFSQEPDNSIHKAIIDLNNNNVVVKWADQSDSLIQFDLLQSMATVSEPSAQALNNGSYWN